MQSSRKIPEHLQQKLLRAGILIQDFNAHPLVCIVRTPVGPQTSFYCHYLSQICGSVTYRWVNQAQFEQLQSRPANDTLISLQSYVQAWLLKLIEKTFQMGCSDVHFEPYRNIIQVVTRNNGVLSPYATCPAEWQSSIILFLQYQANINLQHGQHVLYGQWTCPIAAETVLIRVSMMQCLHGISVVLRFHSDRCLHTFPLNALLQTQFARAVQHIIPGLWLIASPAGCGKTTVYYHLLQQAQTKYRVFSFEDPIEIPQPHLLQWAICSNAQQTSEHWMKILLRHSAQLIGLGEVRSKEHLQFVVNAAITGHCVLTTFHAPTVDDVVRRLIIFGYPQQQQTLFLKGILFPKWVHGNSGRQLAFEEKLFKRA